MRVIPERAVLIGVGGLGCPASLGLASAGVRHLTLVDPDVVDVTNLHRQPWHHPADVGRPKVESAAAKLRTLFPGLSVETLRTEANSTNVEDLFRAHQVAIDGTDGAPTKFLLSDAAVRVGIPLVYGGVLRFEGLAMRIERGGPCLRCLFETAPTEAPTCAQAGVLGSMAGLVGALEARLALEPNALPGVGTLHVLDGGRFDFRTLTVKRRSDCGCAHA